VGPEQTRPPAREGVVRKTRVLLNNILYKEASNVSVCPPCKPESSKTHILASLAEIILFITAYFLAFLALGYRESTR
jgi:hypothetical protein